MRTVHRHRQNKGGMLQVDAGCLRLVGGRDLGNATLEGEVHGPPC